VRLYRADLFQECYDEWIEGERDRLRQRYAKTLERLASVLEQHGQYQKALGYAERLLTLDEFNESTYRLMMQLHALNNDHASAFHTYNRCVEVLDEELGIEPSAETQELYHRLTRGAVAPKTVVIKETEIPLVGRESEWSIALETWCASARGRARLLLLSGEAGIGKTRLAQQLLIYVERQGFVVARACCYAAEGRLAYAPVTEWLKAVAIHQTLQNLESVWQTEVARLLPELLAGDANLTTPGPLAESWQRQRFFEALAHTVAACRQPLLLFVDDLQWCDSDTLEWLHYLLRFDPSAKILIVTTVRLEALRGNEPLISLILELRRAGLLTEIELNALDAWQTAQLACHVSGQELDSEAAASLYEETEGSPLFVVEMTRASLEKSRHGSADKATMALVLPQRVQAVIQTRLSHLTPSARKLLEVAAIIGRVFTFEVLARASDYTDEILIQSLDELCDRRLIREQQNAYDFSHDKIREVAAAGISAARGRLFHRRIAEALETVFARQLDQVSGRLASHYEHAGLPLRAISYYERAGKVAKTIFANEEAADYLNQALRLIRNHLDGHDQETRELEIQRVLSTCLVQGRGYGASEVQRTGVRVLELCTRLDEQPDPPLLRMLAISKLVVGEISSAEAIGLQLLEQARTLDDDVVRVEAYYVLGVTYHWQGRFQLARKYLEKAIALYDSKHHHTHITVYVQDPAVVCCIRLALVLWHLGYPFQSQSMGLEALELAEKLAHPFSRAYALHWFAWLQNLRGDREATLKHAAISIAFSEQYDFPYFATQSGILYGWALLQTGDIEDGIQKMREGLSRFRATGSEIGCSYYRSLIAEALA
ncbi:MAG: AAA family ATPase, partial [Bacteroidota bacterium]